MRNKYEIVMKPFPDSNTTNDEWAAVSLTLCENSTDVYFRDDKTLMQTQSLEVLARAVRNHWD